MDASNAPRSTPEPSRDISLPGGCILCGGDLDVRVTPHGATSVCTPCRWISRPHMHRHDGGFHVIHPPGGSA